jgi:hypothetical protein
MSLKAENHRVHNSDGSGVINYAYIVKHKIQRKYRITIILEGHLN